MIRYLAGRLAQAVVVLWAAFTVTFVVLYLLPSDPVSIQLSAAGIETDSLTTQQLDAAKARYGLDRPVLDQYWTLLTGAIHGDFGTSIAKHVPVAQLIGDRIGGTLILSAIAGLLAVLLGTGVAYLAAFVRVRPLQVLLDRLPALGVAVPTFLVGLALIQYFSFELGWLPSAGTGDWRHLVLPVITMALPAAAQLAQVLGRSFQDTLREQYIVTARAKGLSRGQVQLRHALRNAALPTLTIAGLLIGVTVTSSIVVETVFNRNGIGRLAQESVLVKDVPVVQAIVVLAAAGFVLVNLLIDLLYPLLDPRITHSATAEGD
ncbi:ABC transporter permease [Nocardia macrotermitis]|uniref:Glutathione transport system permease protein GsiC n=1 Tax=Nocardia macrotermitis TaxID=2585198 RepID=A0A7K0DB00_9NOCA|nr:ABC transporter permease [Nocardia macrotermitis]MQY22789.1 Glutathione transport system permease protein GsiC [Nocardia macrotermitis]